MKIDVKIKEALEEFKVTREGMKAFMQVMKVEGRKEDDLLYEKMERVKSEILQDRMERYFGVEGLRDPNVYEDRLGIIGSDNLARIVGVIGVSYKYLGMKIRIDSRKDVMKEALKSGRVRDLWWLLVKKEGIFSKGREHVFVLGEKRVDVEAYRTGIIALVYESVRESWNEEYRENKKVHKGDVKKFTWRMMSRHKEEIRELVNEGKDLSMGDRLVRVK